MKQILQSLKNGKLHCIDVPADTPSQGKLLIRTGTSLISAGTERMLLDFGRAGWVTKARQQPDKVKMVVDKIKTDGLLATVNSVNAKLDRPIPMGYSNAGRVIGVGKDVSEFKRGDRVVSNGPHSEVVAVPKNLCAEIPSSVPDEMAAFTVVGAIALEGIRLAQPTLGESVVVTGLGLVGLMTVQLLRAQGCRVLGLDFDTRKLELAENFGAETFNLSSGLDPTRAADMFSRGRGVDAVLITASAKSNGPVHQAALMCRKRARIILVGVVGLELSREDFYAKELSFQVSCSYGPGRYDPSYENGGQDYPHAYVRWTAQRNFEAVLDMMATRRLILEPLITHRFTFERVMEAYELLGGKEFHLGILLEYAKEPKDEETRQCRLILGPTLPNPLSRTGSVGFIGAGGYAAKVLMPAFQAAGADLISVASNTGLSASHAGRRFKFAEVTTDVEALLSDPRIDTIVIATRHDSHAALVCRALKASKHVFVEKPLALRSEEIDEIEATYRALPKQQLLMVGFNRRFAPHVTRAKKLLSSIKGPKALIYTVNAGLVSPDHWSHDPKTGGGRIVGEACHFLDLLRFLIGSPIADMRAMRMSDETVTINTGYEDGSVGTVHYFTNGHKSFPKERLEIFADGRILVIDNFRNLTGFGWSGFKKLKLWRQNKGAFEMAHAVIEAVRLERGSPIPFEELIEVARVTLQATF